MGRLLELAALVAIVLALSGCSKEDLNEALEKAKKAASEGADKVKQQVSQASDKAQEQAGFAGNAEFVVDAPLKTSGCYVQFVPSVGGRSAVLQVRSYKTPDQESFPAMFLQGNVTGSSLKDVVGQTIQVQCWVQGDANTALWAAKGSVELKVVTIDEKSMKGEISGGAMKNLTTGAEVLANGKVNATILP